MRVLVIGGGGREHAICTALSASLGLTKLWCAPGNAGIASVAECVPIKAMEFDKIIAFAQKNLVDVVFVAPDDPLAAGLVNELNAAGIRAFGPTKEAAIIEGSKAFSKGFMKRHGIPTAAYETFTDYQAAAEYLNEYESFPIVLKADGLALGKGVLICEDKAAALEGLKNMMLDHAFGSAGNTVVIEEFLTGKEMTVLAFTDGVTVKTMPACQDHKKAYDNDKGLNTGGMGAFSYTPTYTKELEEETMRNIINPTIAGMREEGRAFKGVIYFGLMATDKGVKVIEYNARFGDPETQAVLPLLKSDLLEIVLAVIDGRLEEVAVEWAKAVGFTVVIASGGYPTNVVKGYPITIGELSNKVFLYHSGTALKEGVLVTNGGRVLCLTTVQESIEEARAVVYAEIDKIKFTDCRYRSDIGIK